MSKRLLLILENEALSCEGCLRVLGSFLDDFVHATFFEFIFDQLRIHRISRSVEELSITVV